MDNDVLKPGAEITTYHFYNIDGLDLLDVRPFAVPVKYSNKYRLLKNDTINLNTFGAKVILIDVRNGSIEISPNVPNDEANNNEKFNVYSGNKIYFDNSQRMFNEINIKSLEDGTEIVVYMYDTSVEIK